MKLNNRGWGLGMMLFLIGVLIIFFGVALFFIYKFYNNFEIENREYIGKPTHTVSLV